MHRCILPMAALILWGMLATAHAADPQTSASPSHTPAWQAEAWYFLQNTSDTSQQQRLTVRLYQPFFLGDGWQLMMREDIRTLYSDEVGPDKSQRSGAAAHGRLVRTGRTEDAPYGVRTRRLGPAVVARDRRGVARTLWEAGADACAVVKPSKSMDMAPRRPKFRLPALQAETMRAATAFDTAQGGTTERCVLGWTIFT
jgi:hypothetical protein